MIKTKIKKRSKQTQTTASGGGSASSSVTERSSVADYATEAGHAASADKAKVAASAVSAETAANATHADSAYDIDNDSPVRDEFLYKDRDDSVKGVVTFDEVQNFSKGARFGNYVADVSGGIIGVDEETGATFAEIDKLYVRLKAFFETLEIAHEENIGGELSVSAGGSVELARVTATSTTRYRCYFLAEQNGQKVVNKWKAGDLAFCKSFNISDGTYTNVSSHYYWRKVLAVSGTPATYKGKKYHYIDLSNASGEYDTDSDAPAVGDIVSQRGYSGTDSPERQTFITISSVNSSAPSITMLKGVNTFALSGCEKIGLGYDATKGHAYFRCYGDAYIGCSDSFMQFDETAKLLKIKARMEMLASSTIEGKSVADYVSSAANAAVPYVNRNYFLNSAFTNRLAHYQVYSALTCEIINDTKHGGNPSLNVTAAENDRDLQRSLYQDLAEVRSGAKLTFSVWVRSPRLNSDTQSVWWIFETGKADGSSAYGSNLYSVPTAANEWQRFTKTVTTPDDCTGIKIWLRLKAGTNVLVSSPKAEYDEKATDWIAAPEDISELNAAATDTADTAAALLAEWAEDGVISPTEQQAVRMEYNNVITERESLIAQMEQYGMKNGTYRSVYVTYYSDSNSYAAELKKLITDSGESVRISDADYFKTIQEAYYTDRQKALTALSTAAQSYVDDNFTKPGDIAYLTDAIAKGESTTVDGGLVLTTKVNVGTTDSEGTYTVNGGLNGAVTSSLTPIIWGGGNMYDRSSYSGTDNAATFLFRADGTGYVCSDYIRFNSDYMGVGGGSGEFLRIDSSGLHLLQDSSYERLEVADKELDVDVDTISTPTHMVWLDKTLLRSSGINGTNLVSFSQSWSSSSYAMTMKKGDTGVVALTMTTSASFNMSVSVINKSTGLPVASGTSTSSVNNSLYQATVKLAFTAPADATYWVRLQVSGNGTVTGTYSSATIYLVGTFSTSSDLGTKIGLYNNALYAAYASSVLLHRQDIGIWRVGKAALRLLPDGSVQIQKDGMTWTDL